MFSKFQKKIKFLKPQDFTLVVSLLCFQSCGNKIEELPTTEINGFQNDRAEEVEFIFSKNGTTTATLSGEEFVQNNLSNPKYVDLKKNIQADFYDDSLQVESKLQANFGRYYPETGNIIVRDSVRVTNRKGERLETEELIWNENIQRFYTEKPVKITMNGQETYGEGLEANKDFSYIKIKNQRGSIPVNKSDLPIEE